MGEQEGYARAQWLPEDVRDLAKDRWDLDLTEEQADEWLSSNAKYIQEAMIQAGWVAIESLLNPEEYGYVHAQEKEK